MKVCLDQAPHDFEYDSLNEEKFYGLCFVGKYLAISGNCKKMVDLDQMRLVPFDPFDGFADFEVAMEPLNAPDETMSRQPLSENAILCIRNKITGMGPGWTGACW